MFYFVLVYKHKYKMKCIVVKHHTKEIFTIKIIILVIIVLIASYSLFKKYELISYFKCESTFDQIYYTITITLLTFLNK